MLHVYILIIYKQKFYRPEHWETWDMTASVLKQPTSYDFDTHNVAEIQNPVVAAPVAKSASNEENETFTFKPKVSAQSKRIVENMGTDFMERQQQHIEKQKKLVRFQFIQHLIL